MQPEWERPRVDDHAGGGFLLKPLALSRALDTLDAFEEAAELAALLHFGLSGTSASSASAEPGLCGISQPDSELALELDWRGAVSSCGGMNHCCATSGPRAPPPTDTVSAHASDETGPVLPAAGTSVKLRTTGLRF